MVISDFESLLQLFQSCSNDIIIYLENFERLYLQDDLNLSTDKLTLKFHN